MYATWIHFISAFYSLNMFSSFGVKKATDSRPQVGRSSADSLHVARQEMQSADGRQIIGRWSAEWKTLWSVKVIGEVGF